MILGGAHRVRRPALSVADGELHLWLLRPPGSAHGLATGELDAAEHRRAAGFLRPADRAQYLAAHVALRRLLSAYTGIPADRLPLGREPRPGARALPPAGTPSGSPSGGWADGSAGDPVVAAAPRDGSGAGEAPAGAAGGRPVPGRPGMGRPVLLGLPGAPHFSLSHSHGVVLVAVSAVPVGVDVQRVPSARTTEACLRALHPEEGRELRRLPDQERPLAFGRLWARKEAYLKGIGTGLTRRPGADYLGERDAHPRPPGWAVRNVPTRPRHAAAVAVRAERDHRAVIRDLPAACLSADRLSAAEPAGLLATARQRTGTVLLPKGRGSTPC